MVKKLGEIQNESVVCLNYDGISVEYYVAAHNYESYLNGNGRTLLVRKTCPGSMIWDASNNAYENSAIDDQLNITYKGKLDSWVQKAIESTNIKYTPMNGDTSVKTLSRSVFLLSLAELGWYNSNANSEGSELPTKNLLRIAELYGNPVQHWTRTPFKRSDSVYYIDESGGTGTVIHSAKKGYRPALTIPDYYPVSDDGTIYDFAPKSISTVQVSMQGQPINIAWDGIDWSDSYVLQRKVDGGSWEQVYAGSDTSYTDTAGSWSTVQYQVCCVLNGTNKSFTQSDVVTVIPASALVISGKDGYLGTITNDISYSVNSNTGNDITLVRTVNGAQVATATVQNGFNYNIPVLDLPTGTNTIVITATMTASSLQVTATRTWTYTKAAASFPTSGGVAALSQDGQPIFPQTLAECVRTIGGPWGGNLSTALDKLALAATYQPASGPLYSEANVDLSKVQAGDIVNLPVKGIMTPHIVLHVGNPDPSMYDSSCDGVWLLRQDIVENGQWNSTNVNTLEGSTIMATMQGYLADYDSTVQAAIQTVKIPYCVGGGDTTVKTLSNGLTCKMFPLSSREVGFSSSNNRPEDGVTLSYFKDGNVYSKRIAYLKGSASEWNLRSPNIGVTSNVWGVYSNGKTDTPFANASYGFRPCFLLPTTFTATYYVDTAGNVYPSQEYTTAGNFYDLLGNVIPSVKIATGSYTGTGTYGSSNPNTLKFPFEPKVIFVASNYYIFIYISGSYGGITMRADSNIANFYGYKITVSKSGNTLSWYYSEALAQMNNSGWTYNYVAIG